MLSRRAEPPKISCILSPTYNHFRSAKPMHGSAAGDREDFQIKGAGTGHHQRGFHSCAVQKRKGKTVADVPIVRYLRQVFGALG